MHFERIILVSFSTTLIAINKEVEKVQLPMKQLQTMCAKEEEEVEEVLKEKVAWCIAW